MIKNKQQSLIGSYKSYWPYFLPMWIFPIVFLLGATVALNHENLARYILYFNIILFIVWCVASTLPWVKKKIAFWHWVIWAVVIPLVIWFISCAVHPDVMFVNVL